jgi:hypothetical protein
MVSANILRAAGLSIALAIITGCEVMGVRDAAYDVPVDPADFSTTIDNPYYPLIPGTTFRYAEKSRFETVDTVVTVTHETKRILGVDCVVVHDVASIDGRITEDTYDWLAQKRDGSVWYFGESTKEISPGGRVSTLGSWEAGIDGAQPGIMMHATPQPGEAYRQEYLAGIAEDMGQVVALGESVTVPVGTFTDTVKTRDWSMLEPGNEFKWYARGIGVVRETGTAGEQVTLLSMTRE